MATAVEWYHHRLLDDPAARPGPRLPALAGPRRRRRPPVQDRLGAGRVGRPRAGAGIDADVLRTTGPGVRQPARPACRTRFRARVLFPIFSDTGEPVAIGGRVLPGSDDPAKYKNSPETPIYAKSKTLYGLNWAKADIAASDQVVVCEGYTDVIGFHQRRRATAPWRRAARRSPRTTSACSSATPAASCWRSTPTPPGRARPSGSTSGSSSYQVQVAVARLPGGADPGELAQQRPGGAGRGGRRRHAVPGVPARRVLGGRPARTPEDRGPARRAGDGGRQRAPRRQRPQAVRRAGRLGGRAARRRPGPRRRAATPSARPSPSRRVRRPRCARTPSSWPSPCSPRTGSRSPSWLVEELFADEAHRRAFLALGAADGNLDAAIEHADPEAREVLERAAVADLDVDADAEARNLIAAAVRRELRQPPRHRRPRR